MREIGMLGYTGRRLRPSVRGSQWSSPTPPPRITTAPMMPPRIPPQPPPRLPRPPALPSPVLPTGAGVGSGDGCCATTTGSGAGAALGVCCGSGAGDSAVATSSATGAGAGFDFFGRFDDRDGEEVVAMCLDGTAGLFCSTADT